MPQSTLLGSILPHTTLRYREDTDGNAFPSTLQRRSARGRRAMTSSIVSSFALATPMLHTLRYTPDPVQQHFFPCHSSASPLLRVES